MRLCSLLLSLRSFPKRPVRLSARTSPFHGGKTGSTPVRATNYKLPFWELFYFIFKKFPYAFSQYLLLVALYNSHRKLRLFPLLIQIHVFTFLYILLHSLSAYPDGLMWNMLNMGEEQAVYLYNYKRPHWSLNLQKSVDHYTRSKGENGSLKEAAAAHITEQDNASFIRLN